MEETIEKEPRLTQEEIQNNRKKLMEYYEENIPFLKLQSEYEELITSIQQSKTNRLIAQIQFAQIMSPSQEERKEETPVRKLKKED
jgi:hypothetical protein